jgi:signal transduction histidine kinase
VIDILSFKAQHKSITINTNYGGIDPERKVRCDERRLIQVLLNLLSNALKFTPVDGHIEICAKLLSNKGSANILSEE